jgi:hypothetical protein
MIKGNPIILPLKEVSPQGLLAGFAPEPATLRQAAKAFCSLSFVFRNDVQ